MLSGSLLIVVSILFFMRSLSNASMLYRLAVVSVVAVAVEEEEVAVEAEVLHGEVADLAVVDP